jgi:hypothetical protein
MTPSDRLYALTHRLILQQQILRAWWLLEVAINRVVVARISSADLSFCWHVMSRSMFECSHLASKCLPVARISIAYVPTAFYNAITTTA